MPTPRKQDIPIESSWRVVEGEHDSFDTSIVYEDDDLFLSSQPSQISSGSPANSFGNSFGNSQEDQLQSFLSRAEDEKVILRSPFRPSVPSSIRHASRESVSERSADPEFFMPSVEVESPRRGGGARPSGAARNVQRTFLRRRQPTDAPKSARGSLSGRHDDSVDQGFGDRLAQSLPSAVFNVLAWGFGIVGLAFRYAQKPLAIVLAVYLIFGGLIIAQNMATKSITASMSPICRIPGASWLNLPFCPVATSPVEASGRRSVEFAGLMNIQDSFEEVLEKSASGVSLPMEMKRSEASVRDLRTMVRYSNLQGKEELVLEFDGFIDTARVASNDLQKFNTHVGSAVDSVISINRWTSRYIDSLSTERQSQGWIQDFAHWAFSPFQPAVFSERVLLDKYVEHTALVSDKIADLILEAQAVLRILSKAEDHLGIIYDFVTRTQKSVQSRKDNILWTLWTLVGANTKHLHNLNEQLSLLTTVDSQRTSAVRQVSDLILELEKIQAGLGDLRDRVAEPELVRASGKTDIPLRVHIETIDRGVERLELARNRIRNLENEKISQVLARGKNNDKMIEST